jgi:hypothetical protein
LHGRARALCGRARLTLAIIGTTSATRGDAARSAVAKPEPRHEAPANAERLSALYEIDYVDWLLENAALLRTGRLDALDTDNIAEELEGMARSEARALRRHLRVLITHLLKWEYRTDHRSSSWRGSTYNARRSIHHRLDESPSLRRRLADIVAELHSDAVFNAANETGLPEATFPAECPYGIETLLDLDHWPGDP